jgi:hypothetical protein
MALVVGFRISDREVKKLTKRYTPTSASAAALGIFCISQIRRRHATRGASGGKSWLPKWNKDGRALLTGRTGLLLDSWFSYVVQQPNGQRVIIANPMPYCHVMELGTRKYGGPIPTIVPKKAKALFIPISDRAARSTLGTAGRRLSTSSPTHELKRGRFHNGQLEVWSEALKRWRVGKPDFIFLMKVDIPPRPQLPTGERERTDQLEFLTQSLV